MISIKCLHRVRAFDMRRSRAICGSIKTFNRADRNYRGSRFGTGSSGTAIAARNKTPLSASFKYACLRLMCARLMQSSPTIRERIIEVASGAVDRDAMWTALRRSGLMYFRRACQITTPWPTRFRSRLDNCISRRHTADATRSYHAFYGRKLIADIAAVK